MNWRNPVLHSCRECGKELGPNETLQMGGEYICPWCKELYIQNLREGLFDEKSRERFLGLNRVDVFIALSLLGIPCSLALVPIGFCIGFFIGASQGDTFPLGMSLLGGGVGVVVSLFGMLTCCLKAFSLFRKRKEDKDSANHRYSQLSTNIREGRKFRHS